jgi:hypothetical protein
MGCAASHTASHTAPRTAPRTPRAEVIQPDVALSEDVQVLETQQHQQDRQHQQDQQDLHHRSPRGLPAAAPVSAPPSPLGPFDGPGFTDLDDLRSHESTGEVVKEHPPEMIANHIRRCVARAARKNGINGEVDQFTPTPPYNEAGLKKVSGRCRTWCDDVAAAAMLFESSRFSVTLNPSEGTVPVDFYMEGSTTSGEWDMPGAAPTGWGDRMDSPNTTYCPRASPTLSLTPYLLARLQETLDSPAEATTAVATPKWR